MDLDDRILYFDRNMASVPESPLPLERPEKRRGVRVLLEDRMPVRLHLRKAELINISLSGAMVEHSSRVRLREVYRLSFPVGKVQVEILARVVQSSVVRLVPVSQGEGLVLYRTGLEFFDLERGVSELLSSYLERLRQPGAGSGMTGFEARPDPEAPPLQAREDVSGESQNA